MHTILVYRHQLFKPSEVFIIQQVGALQRFRPLFVGRKTFGIAPSGTDVITMQELGRRAVTRNMFLCDASHLLEKIRPHNPALIHAHFGVEGVYALGLAKALQIPLVTTFHGFDATTTTMSLLLSGKPSWVNYALFRKKLAREGDLFICVSNYIRNRVLELGFPEERTVVHYIGIDSDAIQPIKKNVASRTILHVARLVEKKGTRYLIEAFGKIARKFADVNLVIIGEGPLRQELENLTNSLGLDQRVNFMGVQPHSEVMNWMSKASIFCLPSVTARSGDSEGLGMVFLEAAAMAVPSVGTFHGGIPEAIEDGSTGFLVPERDVNALAERLEHLLENDSMCEKMGQAARRMVEEKFNLLEQTQKLEDMYEALL